MSVEKEVKYFFGTALPLFLTPLFLKVEKEAKCFWYGFFCFFDATFFKSGRFKTTGTINSLT
jgi:hypothetical protein